MIINFIRCFEACNGQYIDFCEGDDFWISPDKLQRQVDLMSKFSDCKLICHGALSLKPTGEFQNYKTAISRKIWLVNDFIEQRGRGISDVMVQHKLLQQLNPELYAAGVEWITIYARLGATEDLPIHHSLCLIEYLLSILKRTWACVKFKQ